MRMAILLFAMVVAITGLSSLTHASGVRPGAATACMVDVAGAGVLPVAAAQQETTQAVAKAGGATVESDGLRTAAEAGVGDIAACVVGVLCALAWALLLVGVCRAGRMRGAKLAVIAFVLALVPTRPRAAGAAPSLAHLGLLRI